MQIEQELANIVPQKETLLSIGVFDGVHLGHRYLLERLKQEAQEKDLLSGVITFSPHPQSVLHPQAEILWLTDLKDRVQRIRELGIDLTVVLPFDLELAQLSARDFVALLKKYLKMSGLIVGPDFALGRGREGNAQLLRLLGQEMGFTVESVPAFTVDGQVVSSTAIRQALAQGDLEKVKRLMGGYFNLSAKVISANRRGQLLGFPTANLDIKPGQALPNNGVYATITSIDGRHFPSATNIGTRPTFGEGQKTVETHILDYKGDLYGKELNVGFVEKLRNEERFASAEELQAQIQKDIERVRAIVTAS